MSQAWINYLPTPLQERVRRSTGLKPILGNTGWLMGEQVLRMVTGMLVGALVARYLGPAQFGTYNYALSFVGLFTAVSSLGLNGLLVRDVVRDPAAGNAIMGTILALKVIGGLVAMLLAIGMTAVMAPGFPLMFWLVAVTACGLVVQAFDTVDLWFQAQVLSKYSVIAKSIAYVLANVFKLGLVCAQASLLWFSFAGVLEFLLAAVCLLLAYRHHGNRPSAWVVSWKRARHLLTESWPLVLSNLSIVLYMRIDTVMLGHLSTNQQVGLYSVATRLSELWYVVPTAIVASVTPALMKAKDMERDVYHGRLLALFRALVLIALLIAVPMTFLSETLVVLLFGHSYQAAGPVLSVHIWAALFVFLGVAQGPWNIAEGLYKVSLSRSVMGAVLNILLNLALLPRMGAMGAAVATVVSYAVPNYLANLTNRRTREVFKLQTRALFMLK
ncbi:MAG TPA: flippase [Stenomitos sp.]